MSKLNDRCLSKLISILQKGASYRESLDLSYFLSIGVTQAEIGIVDYVQDQLTKCPYLDESDFIEKGISHQKFEILFGGFENVKKLLGIEDYSFAQWLSSQDLSKGLAVPYFLYQKFAIEIKADFMIDKKLHHYLKIELGNAEQYQSIPVDGLGHALIPSTNLETAVVTLLLHYRTHRLVSLNKHTTVMTIEHLKSRQKISIEAKCLASQFCEKADMSVCVIDDSTQIKNMPKLREIKLLQDLIAN